ncbi:unnamed protein product [Ceutorhynchus assimilis]|uniref:Glutathione S-transferase n=1 Tax=Ceutorhynchus assimilis TaxID=467358 RepID=A0A9N9MGF6_9CUCU|nr:unnamed protein product [Ceutorhynchus assimilis]
MAPKLHSIIASPPVRAVLMCAKVLDVELELIPVDVLSKDHLKEEYLKKNPQHTVPLLEEDDGFLLADSHAIMGYLVNQYGKDDSLYPKNDSRLRAVIDHILHLDSSVLFIRGLLISKPLLFQKILPTEEKIKDLKEAFQILDAVLEKNQTKYVAGNSLTIADFSVVTTITCFDIFTPYAEFPHLKAYIERMEQESWYELNKEGLALNKKMIGELMNELKNQ